MTTQHIGAAGEFLVQYRLLKLGIDSARLTVDAGVDLVVYSPVDGRAYTVQVKANDTFKPSGGRGAASSGFFFPHSSPAQILAAVRLSTDTVWLVPMDTARALAQQHSPKGIRQLYFFPDEAVVHRRVVPMLESEMAPYLLENIAPALFLGEPAG